VILPILHQLRKHFNISISEVDHLDTWNRSFLACAVTGNNKRVLEGYCQKISKYANENYPSIEIIDSKIEIL